MLLGFEVSSEDLKCRLAQGDDLLLLDVRTFPEHAAAHIEGSKLAPLPILKEKLPTIADWKNKPVVVYCQTGQRSMDALLILKEAGFTEIKMLEGGMDAWSAEAQRDTTA